MASKSRIFIHFLILLFFSSTSICTGQKKVFEFSEDSPTLKLFETLNSNDTIIDSLKESYEASIKKKDTLAQIQLLNKLGLLYCNRINYEDSYNSYWKALLLAEKKHNNIQKAKSYNGLAILYSLYERRSDALDYYLKALAINKSLVQKKELEATALVKNYLPLATHYFYDENPTVSEKYVDSCEQIIPIKHPEINYVKAQRGYTYLLTKEYDKAEKQLLPIEEYFKENNPGHLVVFYAMLGDVYRGKQQFTKAIDYYKRSNKKGYEYKTHLNFIPDTFEKLSEVHHALNQESEALRNQVVAHEINQYLYSSRSPNNQYLLEIKDQFMQEKERLHKLAAAQKLEQLAHQESLWKLRYTIISISTLFLIGLGIWIYRYLSSKHRNEKKLLLQKKKMENQQSTAILEIKNKELTESTLRLIAKDELLNDIKSALNTISSKPTSNSIKKLIKQININSKENWTEFESRFTMVNDGFYERMKERFPELSPYDLKVSALVKLGFSGKEMAKVMGISPESANTARYRLRKRLGLSKEDNLVQFIRGV